jgi:hypothetical protein
MAQHEPYYKRDVVPLCIFAMKNETCPRGEHCPYRFVKIDFKNFPDLNLLAIRFR